MAAAKQEKSFAAKGEANSNSANLSFSLVAYPWMGHYYLQQADANIPHSYFVRRLLIF